MLAILTDEKQDNARTFPDMCQLKPSAQFDRTVRSYHIMWVCPYTHNLDAHFCALLDLGGGVCGHKGISVD